MSDTLKQEIKAFILSEFLPGENPDDLTDSTPLISAGVLDSIATLKLVMHVEEKYGVGLEPHEVDKENLDSIELIARLLHSKGARPG